MLLKRLMKEPYVQIVRLINGVNYYFIALFLAISYDDIHKLNGGPATMTVGLLYGPIIAIALWIITNVLLTWFLKKHKNLLSGIIIVFHLLCLLILLFFIAVGIYFYYSEAITSPFNK